MLRRMMMAGGPPPPVGTTWDPSYKGPNITLTNSNIDAARIGTGLQTVFGTTGRSSGKYQFEIVQLGGTTTARPIMGVADKTNGVAMQGSYIGNTGMEYSLGLWGNGQIYGNLGGGLIRTSSSTTSTNDVVTVMVDMDNDEIEIFLNGVSKYTTSVPSGKTWYPAASMNQNGAVRIRVTGMSYPQPGFSDWG